ncbi:MAG: hypothetical protein IKG40_04805 [Bacilli bacterium]|nr:hypothetical protein [Bacilli bacterium]
MDEILEKTKILLDNDEKYTIGDVCKMWPMTNENLKEVYKLFDVKDKSVLTVTSSGDHIFESMVAGAKVVDSFDVNYLTEYYYYLKKAMIKNYKLKLYLDIIESLSYGIISTNSYDSVRDELNGEGQLFWDQIIDWYRRDNDFCIENLYNTTINIKQFNLVNYLCKSNFKLLKKMVDSYNIGFIHSDLFSLDDKLDKTYDFIYLSNIYGYVDKVSYFGLNKVKEYAKCKLYPYLNDGGTIVYGYLYGYSLDHFNSIYGLKDKDEGYYPIDGTYGRKDCLFTLKK